MNHTDLIDSIVAKTGLSKTDVTKVVDATVDSIKDALVAKEKLTIKNFGILSTKEKPAREARNPATGGVVQVASKTAIKFKPTKTLAEAVNG